MNLVLSTFTSNLRRWSLEVNVVFAGGFLRLTLRAIEIKQHLGQDIQFSLKLFAIDSLRPITSLRVCRHG
jgi:hypothetical protein